MRAICLSLMLLFVCHCYADKMPSRNQLLQLYHQAAVAKKNNNFELAIDNYSTIIELVPQLPEPYLYIAEMYDVNSNGNKEYTELAIFFYRKYIDIEFDDSKTLEVRKRLKQIENQVGVVSYEKILAEDEAKVEEEYNTFIAEIEEKETSKPEVSETKEEEPILAIETITPENNITNEVPKTIDNVLDTSKIEETNITPTKPSNSGNVSSKYKLLYPIEISADRNSKNIWKPTKISMEDLNGRWVSGSRMPNNRETWIFDIDCQGYEINITLNSNSGVLSIQQWDENILNSIFERTSLINMADKSSFITSSDDISFETMQMIDNISSKTVTAKVQNDTLKFKYNLNLNYNTIKGKYDWLRTCGAGLSTVLSTFGRSGSFIGSLVDKLTDNLADKAESEDTPIKYNAEIGFKLMNTPDGLIGIGSELLVEKSEKGEKAKKSRKFQSVFYKVKNNYNGYNSIENYEKTDFQLNNERTLINTIKKNVEKNDSLQYLLAVLYDNSVGERTEKDNFKKTYKQMLKAAENGNIDAAIYLINVCYKQSLDINKSKAERKKYLRLAEEWSQKTARKAPIAVKCAQAKYAIDSKCDYDRAMLLYQETLGILETGDVYNKLGELSLNAYSNANDAIKYFNLAIKLGDTNAMLNLAELYRKGKGIEQNTNTYIKWVTTSYENGNIEAINHLADIYFKGIGVEQNYFKGMKYAELYKERLQNNWKETLEKIRPNLLYIVK